MPFGMVKLGLDTYEEPVNQSALNGGWTPKGWVTGISMLHESGTGGGPKYGWASGLCESDRIRIVLHIHRIPRSDATGESRECQLTG